MWVEVEMGERSGELGRKASGGCGGWELGSCERQARLYSVVASVLRAKCSTTWSRQRNLPRGFLFSSSTGLRKMLNVKILVRNTTGRVLFYVLWEVGVYATSIPERMGYRPKEAGEYLKKLT